MTKRVLISTAFLMLLASSCFSQNRAQATMRVSVRIISGSSIEIAQPEMINFGQGQTSSLGMLTMMGLESDEVLIRTSSRITLCNKRGEKLTMEVFSQRKDAPGYKSIHYKGISKSLRTGNIYTGALTTTIEYL